MFQRRLEDVSGVDAVDVALVVGAVFAPGSGAASPPIRAATKRGSHIASASIGRLLKGTWKQMCGCISYNMGCLIMTTSIILRSQC